MIVCGVQPEAADVMVTSVPNGMPVIEVAPTVPADEVIVALLLPFTKLML